ncbi:MAG: hypothetical protein KJ000_00005, partial [Pirellulaceae bacterium]|nr:hypothetical protein [Pirellulaceae bacterium]
SGAGLGWSVGSSQWSVGSGQLSVGGSQLSVGSSQLSVGSGQLSVGSGQLSVGSGQLFGTDFSQRTTDNGQQPTAAYDLLTVLTHELGHVLGHADLDPHDHPDHLMASILQPGTGRIVPPAGGHDSGLALLFNPAAGGRGPQCVANAERGLASETLFSPAAGGRGPLLFDRALDDLLRDDLRVSKDAWRRDEESELELLATGRSSEQEADIDDFFAQL